MSDYEIHERLSVQFYNFSECLIIIKECDLCLIKLDFAPNYYFEIEIENFEIHQNVYSAGYPNYNFTRHEKITIDSLMITSLSQTVNNARRLMEIIGVNGNLPKGMSGGPILNKRNMVVGVISNGDDSTGEISTKRGFIPLKSMFEHYSFK